MNSVTQKSAGVVIALLLGLATVALAFSADLAFSGWRKVPGQGKTATANSAAVYDNRLYLFGIGTDDHAHHMNVFDGARWTGWHPVPGGGTTSLPDSATSYQGKLYLFGIGSGDHAHYVNIAGR